MQYDRPIEYGDVSAMTVFGMLLLVTTLTNPYLAEFDALSPEYHRQPTDELIYSDHGEATQSLAYRGIRDEMLHRYAWAVPTTEAIDAIASRCPHVVDFGAGAGYWDMLLSQRGVTVRAADDWSWWGGDPPKLWFPVEQGSYEWLDQFDASWCLLLVWPPRDAMARTALEHWKGSILIYVGEFMRGTGDPGFHWQLLTQFEALASVDLPHWWNRSDWLYVFRRR